MLGSNSLSLFGSNSFSDLVIEHTILCFKYITYCRLIIPFSRFKANKLKSVSFLFILQSMLACELKFFSYIQGIISVISNRFGTEQARTIFPLSSGKKKPSSKKEKAVLSARYCKGKFFIALANSLICIECNIFSTSLASALGRLKRFEFNSILN